MTDHLSMPAATGRRSTVVIAPGLTSGLPAGMTWSLSDGMFLSRSIARIELNFWPGGVDADALVHRVGARRLDDARDGERLADRLDRELLARGADLVNGALDRHDHEPVEARIDAGEDGDVVGVLPLGQPLEGLVRLGERAAVGAVALRARAVLRGLPARLPGRSSGRRRGEHDVGRQIGRRRIGDGRRGRGPSARGGARHHRREGNHDRHEQPLRLIHGILLRHRENVGRAWPTRKPAVTIAATPDSRGDALRVQSDRAPLASRRRRDNRPSDAPARPQAARAAAGLRRRRRRRRHARRHERGAGGRAVQRLALPPDELRAEGPRSAAIPANGRPQGGAHRDVRHPAAAGVVARGVGRLRADVLPPVGRAALLLLVHRRAHRARLPVAVEGGSGAHRSDDHRLQPGRHVRRRSHPPRARGLPGCVFRHRRIQHPQGVRLREDRRRRAQPPQPGAGSHPGSRRRGGAGGPDPQRHRRPLRQGRPIARPTWPISRRCSNVTRGRRSSGRTWASAASCAPSSSRARS